MNPRMLWALGLFPRRLGFGFLAIVFGVFALFFLVKSVQFNGPSCVGAPVCAFSIVFLVFGVMFALVAGILALFWALDPLVRRLWPPAG